MRTGTRAVDGERGERLQKFLARAGAGSRRECERFIREGRVSVDGTVVTELGTRVRSDESEIRLDGQPVRPQPERWIALYKPAGYLSTRADERDRPTVYSLLPGALDHLFYVGRLDRLSEGLLLFTNDGEAANRLLHPRYQLPRRYRVELTGYFGPAEARRLEEGLNLEDGPARAYDVEYAEAPRVRGGEASSVVSLTLNEGRKREVRRMMAELGLTVRRLIRISFGTLKLSGLEPGDWRDLKEYEIAALRAAVGLGDKWRSTKHES